MTMACNICNHPNRLEIDREVVQGRSIASIARKFDLNYNALNNHANNHIARQLSQVYQKRELQENMDLLGKIDQIISRAENIFQRNYKAKRDGVALKALAEQRSTIDLLAKISYNLHQAKLAELEIQRHQSGEVANEKSVTLTKQSVKVLNKEELRILKQLFLKMGSQDKDMIVVPEEPVIYRDVPRKTTNPAISPTNNEISKDIASNSAVQGDIDESLTVHPVEPTPISKKRNDQPISYVGNKHDIMQKRGISKVK